MQSTYVLQGIATLGMLASCALIGLSLQDGNYPLAVFNLFLFVINAGLFYWQGTIRAGM